jgi:iron complex outermembrane receptor protein
MVLAYQAGSLSSTFDLESIEVLRGPQGVLFGRNSSGGAIAMRTRRPRPEFEMLADISYGNFNTLDAAASVGGALGSDAILGKIALLYRRTDGFIKNSNEGVFEPAPGNPTGQPVLHRAGHIGAQDQITIKPTFVFNVSGATTLTIFGQYQRHNDDGSTSIAYIPKIGGPYQLQTIFGFTPPDRKYQTNLGNPGYFRLRGRHVISELVNEVGDGKITTVASYRNIRLNSTANIFGSPFDLYLFPENVEKNKQYSLESRINYPISSNIDLTAGVFYLNTVSDVVEKRTQVAFPSVRYTLGQFEQTTEAIAGYANLDWKVVDGLTLSAGGRYSSEKKDFTGAPLAVCGGSGFANCPQVFASVSKRWNDFSPRLVLTYQATPDALVYGSYTQGFRSGNINSRVTTAVGFAPADPETVTSYEVGTKLDLLDRTLRLNLSAFLSDYSDIQQVLTTTLGNPPVLVQTLVNAASARTQGVEAEITIRPDRTFQFDAALGYLDAKFKDFTVPVPGVADPTSLKFARVPKYTMMLAATHRWQPAGLAGEISTRISYDFRSAFFADTQNVFVQPAYGLMNANVSYEINDWTVAIFARNLGNIDYAGNIGGGTSVIKWGGQPRTYGVRFTSKIR